mgnify:CR=1 FL=1
MGFSTMDVNMPQQELFYSFMGTDANTDATIEKFFQLLSLLTQMASIRTIVWRLAEEVKRTQRRVNALDKMIIPQTKETKAYIESVLEERERENVFVLKALKKKKRPPITGWPYARYSRPHHTRCSLCVSIHARWTCHLPSYLASPVCSQTDRR